MQTEPDASVCKLPGERAGETRLVVENLSTFYGEAQALNTNATAISTDTNVNSFLVMRFPLLEYYLRDI